MMSTLDADASPEKFRIEFDAAAGIVRAAAHDLWTLADTRSYAAALRAVAQKARSRSESLRVLIDIRNWPVQRAEVSELLGKEVASVYRPRDRVATVMSSALLTMQVTRISVDSYQLKSFSSPEAAETWLLAED